MNHSFDIILMTCDDGVTINDFPDLSTDSPRETQKNTPIVTPITISRDTLSDITTMTPRDTPNSTPSDISLITPRNTISDITPNYTPRDTPNDTPNSTPNDTPTDDFENTGHKLPCAWKHEWCILQI